MRKGEAMPPISVYRVGELHFVEDGHHRVSVARELGLETIDAYVTEIQTKVGAEGSIAAHDLALKSHERLFFERVPLPPEAREADPATEQVALRRLRRERRGLGLSRHAGRADGSWTARRSPRPGSGEEYVPVVEMLREAGLIGRGTTETEAYDAVSGLRYLLLRTHDWDEETLRGCRRSSAARRRARKTPRSGACVARSAVAPERSRLRPRPFGQALAALGVEQVQLRRCRPRAPRSRRA